MIREGDGVSQHGERGSFFAMRQCLSLLLVLLAGVQAQPFVFIHASDTHAPLAGSKDVIAKMSWSGEKDVGGIPWKLPPPEFAVVTGDLTEFGGTTFGKPAFDAYRSWFLASGLPTVDVLGNHDATWDSLRPRLFQEGVLPFRVFERKGVGFIILDTSTPQDPRPSLGADAVHFLRTAIRELRRDLPIFVFSHHAPDGPEFASARERAQILDLLDGHRIVAWCVGHYHTAFRARSDGLMIVGGGSTLPKTPEHRGFNIVAVHEGRAIVAFQRYGGDGSESRILLDQPTDVIYRIPLVIEAPEPGTLVGDGPLPIVATAYEPCPDGQARARVEGTDLVIALTQSPASEGATQFRGEMSLKDIPGGDYVLTIDIGGGEAARMARSVSLQKTTSKSEALQFRTEVEGSVRSLQTFGDKLLVGCSNGQVFALDAQTGSKRFELSVGGEVLARPVAVDGVAYVPSTNGLIRAINSSGKVLWVTDLKAPISSSPALSGEVLFAATGTGELVTIKRNDGTVLSRQSAAEGVIEAPLALEGSWLAFGAWDERVHVWRKEGLELHPKWKAKTAGVRNARAAARYFSPGDAEVAISGEWAYVADRASVLSAFALETGELRGQFADVVACAPGPDPGSVVARGKNDEVLFVRGTTVSWRIRAATGNVPSPPVHISGRRYLVVSDRGEVTIFEIGAEAPLLNRSLMTGGYHLATPLVSNGLAYFGSLDGTVSAWKVKD